MLPASMPETGCLQAQVHVVWESNDRRLPGLQEVCWLLKVASRRISDPASLEHKQTIFCWTFKAVLPFSSRLLARNG